MVVQALVQVRLWVWTARSQVRHVVILLYDVLLICILLFYCDLVLLLLTHQCRHAHSLSDTHTLSYTLPLFQTDTHARTHCNLHPLPLSPSLSLSLFLHIFIFFPLSLSLSPSHTHTHRRCPLNKTKESKRNQRKQADSGRQSRRCREQRLAPHTQQLKQ